MVFSTSRHFSEYQGLIYTPQNANLAESFQEVEEISALQSSIRFIPHPVMGAATIATAYLISRVKVQYLAVVYGVVTVIAPILMATVEIGENYWFAPFWALLLSLINPDGMYIKPALSVMWPIVLANGNTVLFTASNLVISDQDSFPPEVQSLAGGVFNEVAQFGNSVGLAVTAPIAVSVTEYSKETSHRDALMEGYRAAFWTIFAATAVVVIISYIGLRKGGKVG